MSLSIRSVFGAALIVVSLGVAPSANAVTFQTLHAFTNTDGAHPRGGLVLDPAGNLFGTTSGGGNAGIGTIFRVNPSTRGFTTLYHFAGTVDGSQPRAGLVRSNGLLYGTAYSGSGASTCGTAFELNPATRALRPLHAFSSVFGPDGCFPAAALGAKSGILYGTTFIGGAHFGGTVFQIDPATGQLLTLRAFDSISTSGLVEGAQPQAGVVLASGGAIYGTTSVSARTDRSPAFGTVFKLTPGTHALVSLHNFTGGADGATPLGDLLLSGGALYGTASAGARGFGVVFKLDPATRQYTVLHRFTGGADGATPFAGLTMRGGALYGTTTAGGANSSGTVFKLALATNQLTTLHAFTSGRDGGVPIGGVIFDSSGALYGTASAGANGFGTVFKLVP